MLVESLAASLILGKIRGGKFINIGKEEIKGWYLIVSSFVLEYGAVFFAGKGSDFVKTNIFYIHSFSYLLLLIGVIMNIKKISFQIMTVGVLLNLIVILSNGGQMPVSIWAMEKAGLLRNIDRIYNRADIVHCFMEPTTKLWFLGDVFPIGRSGFFSYVVSIGDIIMSLGVFVYIQRLMLGNRV